MQPVTRAYVATANLVRDRIETAREDERGVSVLEYMGLALIVAAIIVTISQAGLGDMIQGAITDAINQITDVGP